MMKHLILAEMQRLVPGGVDVDVSLRDISRWRIGGTADIMVSPSSTAELAAVRGWLHSRGVPSVLVAGTSNLLFADSGLRAVVIRLGKRLANVSVDGDRLRADAGAWVPGIARTAMTYGLTGIEHTCGIPGTIGGLICMNGGSMRRGIGEVVESVTIIEQDGSVSERSGEACGFAYRRSVFQTNLAAVAQVNLRLRPAGERGPIRREMLRILRDRRGKFPQKLPNCGSVFVSDPSMYEKYGPPGKVIESVGLKGTRIGGARVSPMHANFIVNEGAASSADVLSLISLIKESVLRRTGYSMAVEARFVSPEGDILEI